MPTLRHPVGGCAGGRLRVQITRILAGDLHVIPGNDPARVLSAVDYFWYGAL